MKNVEPAINPVNYFEEKQGIFIAYISHIYSLTKFLHKFAVDLKSLEDVITNFAGDLIRSQIELFLNTSIPSVKKFKEMQLAAFLFPASEFHISELNLEQIKVKFPNGEEKTLPDIFKSKDNEILKILLYRVLRDFNLADTGPISSSFAEFSTNLYKTLKHIFEATKENSTPEIENNKLQLIFIIDLMNATHDRMHRVIKYDVTSYQMIKLLQQQFLSLAKYCPNDKEQMEHVDDIVLKFSSIFAALKNTVPCLVEVYENEVKEKDVKIFKEKAYNFSFQEHPLHVLQLNFIVKNVWQKDSFTKFEAALISLMTNAQNAIAQQLKTIFNLQNFSPRELYEEFPSVLKKLEEAAQTQSKTVTRNRSQSLIAAKKTSVVSSKRGLQRTKSKSLGEEKDFEGTPNASGFFGKNRAKKEEAIPVNDNFPKIDIQKFNEALVEFSISSLTTKLKEDSEELITFTQTFESKAKELDSYWIKNNFNNFLGTNLELNELKLLKLLLMAHYFDPTITKNKADNLYERKEENQETLLEDIEYIFASVPVQIRDLSCGYSSLGPLTIKDIFTFYDLRLVEMLNAFNSPSQKSDRNPFEKKADAAIKFLTSLVGEKIALMDYDSLCFQFYINSMGTIITHLQDNWFKPLINYWFFFSQLVCAFKKLNLKSKGTSMLESFFFSYTNILKKLMNMDMSKRIAADIFAGFCGLYVTPPLAQLENLFTFDFREAGMLEAITKLDCGNLLAGSSPQVEKIKAFQEFINEMFCSLANQLSRRQTILSVYNEIKNQKGIGALFQMLDEKEFKKELIEFMLENLKEFSITRAEYIEKEPKLETIIPESFKPHVSESNEDNVQSIGSLSP